MLPLVATLHNPKSFFFFSVEIKLRADVCVLISFIQFIPIKLSYVFYFIDIKYHIQNFFSPNSYLTIRINKCKHLFGKNIIYTQHCIGYACFLKFVGFTLVECELECVRAQSNSIKF